MSLKEDFQIAENLFKIGNYQEALKIFSTLLQKTIDTEDRIPILFYTIDLYRLTGNIKKGKKLLSELEKISRKSKETSPKALLQYLLLSSRYYNDLGSYEKAILTIKEAFILIKEDTNSFTIDDEVEALNILGASQTRIADYIEALDSYRKAKNLAQKSNNVSEIIISLNNSADILEYLGDRENAKKYYLQALDYTKKQVYYKAAIYSGLAQILYSDLEFDEALIFLDQVNSINQETNLLSCFSLFIEILIAIDKKNYAKLLKKIKILKSFYKLNSNRADTWITYALAYYYFNIGNNNLADKYCFRCFELTLKTNDTLYSIKALILLTRIYLAHYYRTLDDFILNKLDIITTEAYELAVRKKYFPLQVELLITRSQVSLVNFNFETAIQHSNDALSLARSLPLRGEEIKALLWFDFINKSMTKMKRHTVPVDEFGVEQIFSYFQKIRKVVKMNDK